MARVNLFLIGVNKAGTSWLYYLLNQHPAIFMSDVKELYFFGEEGRDAERPSTVEAYHDHFPFQKSYRYFGDATVMYYRSQQAAAEIEAYNPDAKHLAIVRDPIERLLSQYRYHKQIGMLAEDTTLEEALDGRDPRLLYDSHYEKTLGHYTDRFGPDQLDVVSLEAVSQNPRDLWSDLHAFLDLPEHPLPPLDERPENPTGGTWFRRIYRHTIPPLRRIAPGAYRWMLSSRTVRQIKLALLRILGTAKKEPLSDALRRQLADEFAPTYAYLRDDLGFDVYDDESQTT